MPRPGGLGGDGGLGPLLSLVEGSMKVHEYGKPAAEVVVMDAVPTDVLVRVYDLADRAAARWAERARMVQLCHDAGFGSWKRLRGLGDRELEQETMSAVWVMAGRERAKASKIKTLVVGATEQRVAEVCQNQVAAAVAR